MTRTNVSSNRVKPLTLILLALSLGLYGCTTPQSDKFDITGAWIAMPDGVRLAADIYWPAGSDDASTYPVLLEYLPYRKDESRARNYALYSYFLDRGYVVARVDIRGTGNSEGKTIPYEYSEIELNDGEVVIDWLARQSWSSGNVGMFGISWGGFNSIQMAMRNPPALKAFVAVMATEYLYQEDVHYIDGIMHTDSWMMSNDLYNALPGAPEFKLDDDWLNNRFNIEPSVYTYMRHQRDGPFWDRASARGQYEKIRVPGYHIGGWYDGYRNSLPRMLEHADAPVKAMIGPWDHYFPHNAWPAPQVEWRAEAVRWFDHFLRAADTGILDEPRFAIYVRNYHEPSPDIASIPGHWRWESGWPIDRTDHQRWYLRAGGGLGEAPERTTTDAMDYKPSMGLEGGGPTMWWGSITPDQQPMDDESLVYDSAPLSSSLEILGRPLAKLTVTATATRANWVVRISDVAPDGQVTQVAGGAFNGTHRHSPRQPEDITPGEPFPLEIKLHFTSWVFKPGHKVRIALSNAQWPMLWPTPMPFESTVAIGGERAAHLVLPVIPSDAETIAEHKKPLAGFKKPLAETKKPLAGFKKPLAETKKPLAGYKKPLAGYKKPLAGFKKPTPDPVLVGFETLDSGTITGYAAIDNIHSDPDTGDAVGIAKNSGATQYPWGIERFDETIEHRTSDKNPARTAVNGRYKLTEELADRTLEFEQTVEFRSDEKNFYLTFHRWLLVNGEMFAEKSWKDTFPRDFQ